MQKLFSKKPASMMDSMFEPKVNTSFKQYQSRVNHNETLYKQYLKNNNILPEQSFHNTSTSGFQRQRAYQSASIDQI